MTDKAIRWIGSSLKDLTNFPDAVRIFLMQFVKKQVSN